MSNYLEIVAVLSSTVLKIFAYVFFRWVRSAIRCTIERANADMPALSTDSGPSLSTFDLFGWRGISDVDRPFPPVQTVTQISVSERGGTEGV